MTLSRFSKVGGISVIHNALKVPIAVEGNLEQTFDSMKKGRERAEQELRRFAAEAQGTNVSWATERLEILHHDPQYRLVDTILVGDDGRVGGMWSSFLSYLNYPKTQPPPKIDELLRMVMEKGTLLYPLISRRFEWVFCRDKQLPFVRDATGGDAEFFPYGDDGSGFTVAFTPDRMLTPARAKSGSIALGDLGLWAIGENYVMEQGDPDKTVDYEPRVYMTHGRHPSGSIYITPFLKSRTIAAGHLPMDERTGTIRVEMDTTEQDIIKRIFGGYEKDNRVNGVPLVLRHRPYTPWTGFYPKHSGSR